MARRKKICSNCGIIPSEKQMRKLADQNFYCNDCRGALIDCSAKELKNLGHPYYLNFQKLKNEQGQLRRQQRSRSQELTTLRQEKNMLTSQLTNLRAALDKANQEIQNEREIHQDSLKIQDDWYRRLPPDSNNLKNILTDFAQKYLKLNLKNKFRKLRLETSLELAEQLANFQIQELQKQLTELQQENDNLKDDLEFAVKGKKEVQKDIQKAIQIHQQEILQLQTQIQHQDSLELAEQLANFQIQELQKQLTGLQQENDNLKDDLEFAVKEKKEVQKDIQKVIQIHQQEILQLQTHQELPKLWSFLRRG